MRIGPYRIAARIGSGGVAEVHAATRFGASGFHKLVAIKTLLPALADDPELQRLLIAEAKLGASLGHRNLVAVHDLGVDEGRYYVVMEHVDGADLRRVLEAGPLQPELAGYVAGEIAAALAYLHTANDEHGHSRALVHRDVTPSNVLVSRTGEVKLADYGIAKSTALASRTAARIVRGTYAYLSPEQIAGGSPTAKSDQFALGVVLVEMLTGTRPFDGDDVATTLERIRSAQAPDLSAVPEPFASIARRCLAADPADRFADTHALFAALAPTSPTAALAQRVG
jgi:serine/threonine-protein kinase